MKDLKQVFDLDGRVAYNRLAADKEIRRIKYNLEQTEKHLFKLNEKLPKIEQSLNDQGLTITSIGYSKTGMGDDWKDDDSLNVSIKAEPINGKFRFLTFKGYNKRGRGLNGDRLDAKAARMVQQLIEDAELANVSVNPFSLEVRDKHEKKVVLMTIWLKA